MDTSPVKFAHSVPKRSRLKSNWELCVICQISTNENLSNATEKGKTTLLDAIDVRQGIVYRRLYNEFESTKVIPLEQIKYHRSCYKAYTSRKNLKKIQIGKDQCSTSSANHTVFESTCVKTRSTVLQLDWSKCLFCRQKSYKRDKQLRRVKSFERADNKY